MRAFNADYTRLITDAHACGISCYEGRPVGDHFEGVHQGACRDWEDAQIWLDGGTPASFIRIYPVPPPS